MLISRSAKRSDSETVCQHSGRTMKWSNRKILRFACLTLLLAGGIALCVVRWQAWFGNPPEPALTGDTIAYQFRTFADSATYAQRPQTPHYQILLLGDVHNSLTRADYQKIAHEAGDLAAYAQLGDFVERCYPFYFQQLYRELQGTSFDSLPLINCPGNHEYRKGLRRSLPDLWYQNFPQPLNGPQDFLGSTYYIDFPNLRFIVLDTNGMQWLHEYMRTLTWLNSVMAGGDDRFVVVMMHHPVYSCGAGRFNTTIYTTFAHALRDADLVFAGHDHNYARRLPFVNTNAATKFYLNKVNPHDTRIASGCRFYELLTISGDTLTLQSRLLQDTLPSTIYDEVQLIRLPDGTRQITDFYRDSAEIILLPERYAHRNDLKVRRFRNRLEERKQ